MVINESDVIETHQMVIFILSIKSSGNFLIVAIQIAVQFVDIQVDCLTC